MTGKVIAKNIGPGVAGPRGSTANNAGAERGASQSPLADQLVSGLRATSLVW